MKPIVRRLVLPGAAAMAWFALYSFATPAAAQGPDLSINAERLAKEYDVVSRTFVPTDCAVEEGLVSGPGTFTLLRFTTATPNVGNADLVIGDPTDPMNPYRVSGAFQFSACHGHYHFAGYALYELLTPNGQILVSGRKQAFCLEDSNRIRRDAPKNPFYTCDFQGITAGWDDVYSKYLAGQWLDVTGVLPGNYLLRVTINPDGILPDADLSNNQATVPVTISKVKK